MLSIDWNIIWVASLFIYGLNFATDYNHGDSFKDNGFKNVLWRLRYWSLTYIGEYWSRPLFTCTICMSSVWGTIIYLLMANKYNPIEWLLSVVVIAGLSRLLRNFV